TLPPSAISVARASLSPTREAFDRRQSLGAAFVYGRRPGRILHDQHEVDPAAANRQPISWPCITRQSDDCPSVRLAHHVIAAEGIPLGGVLDEPPLSIEGGKAPPGPAEVVHDDGVLTTRMQASAPTIGLGLVGNLQR